MYRYIFRALGVFLIALPEPVITNSIGSLLILASFLPQREEILYAPCGCDFHRYGWYREEIEGLCHHPKKEVMRYERGQILAGGKNYRKGGKR